MSTPIEDHVQELTDRYYRVLEPLEALDSPMTIDQLSAELKLDTDEVHDQIAYIPAFDRIHQDSNTVVPVE